MNQYVIVKRFSVTLTAALVAAGSFGAGAAPAAARVQAAPACRWKLAATENVRGSSSYLAAATADGPRSAWAVGYSQTRDGVSRPLIERSVGSGWSVVPAPASQRGALDAVSASSPSDVWAVGGGASGVLVDRFDGAGWRAVAGPRPGGLSVLLGVSAISSQDVWAAGEYSRPGVEFLSSTSTALPGAWFMFHSAVPREGI